MILKEISDLIVVDQLNIENNEKYAFFISYPSEDLLISNNFKSRIYTSSHIGNIFSTIKKDQIPIKCFKILRNGEKEIIQLSNGDNLIVTMFKDEEPTRNILYHFEINSCTAVYLGHFKQIPKLIWNKTFLDLVSKGINYLYIDNTNSKSIYHSTEFEICYKIKQLLKTHTKIIINTPEFGYEDLIKTFIDDFNFKVFVKNDITRNIFYNTTCNGKFLEFKDSDIAMIKDSPNLELIEKRLNSKKIATIRLFDFQQPFDNKTYEKIGLYQFSYSSHISRMQMFTLISLIQPQNIKEIYPEFSPIPNFIKSASKRWNYVMDEPDIFDNSKTENLDEIENFAPKTQIINTDQLADYIDGTVSESQLNMSNCVYSWVSGKKYIEESGEKCSDKTKKFNRSDISEKSTDCEEICINDGDDLGDKIRNHIPNIPRRRQIKEILTIDLSSDRPENYIGKINKNNKIDIMENIQKTDLESKNTQETAVNDEFGSLLNSKLSGYPESQMPNFFINSRMSSHFPNQTNLNNENLQIENKKVKESNENYFSFLDNNSLSSKKSVGSNDEKEIEDSCEKNKIPKQKNHNSFAQKIPTEIITKAIVNNASPSSFSDKDQQKRTESIPTDNKNKQSKQNSNENNELSASQLSINFTLVENVVNSIEIDCIIPKNNKTEESAENKNTSIKKSSSRNENKNNETAIIKEYNPFRKRLYKSDDNHDDEELNISTNSINKRILKSILKETKTTPITPIKTEASNSNKKNNSNNNNNNSNKKDTSTSRKSSSSRKRHQSSSSVEVIDDSQEDVIEIIDNSPSSLRRNARRSAKIKVVEVSSNRRITRNQPISMLYIDDED